jgi:hypothetical protein
MSTPTVTITPAQSTLTVTSDSETVTVTPAVSTVTVVTNGQAGTPQIRYRYVGAEFTGANGDAERTKKMTYAIRNNSIIVLGYRVLDPNIDYSISTTTISNDTLTLHVPLDDTDVVMLWN